MKTDVDSTRGSSTSCASTGPGGTTSGTGSSSESLHGSEPPPSRHQRLGSIASLSTATSYLDDSLTSPRMLAHEEFNHGRRHGISSPHSPDNPVHISSRRTGWASQRLPGDGPSNGVPWLDPRNAGSTNIVRSPEAGVLGIHPGPASHTNMSSRTSRSSESVSTSQLSQPPSLNQGQASSHGSNSSASTTTSYFPRTPSEASLPIHALLSSKPEMSPHSYAQTPPLPSSNGHNVQTQPLHQAQPSRPQGAFQGSSYFHNDVPGFTPGQRANYPGQTAGLPHEAIGNLPYELNSAATKSQAGSGEIGLDGISALLRAREIVDRRP